MTPTRSALVHSDAYTQMVADTARRVRMVWDATIAIAVTARQAPPEYAFALAAGHYEVCTGCGAWGGALEMPHPLCDHPAGVRTHRPCWILVTASGESAPLTMELMRAFDAEVPGNAGALRAGGQVTATLDPAPMCSREEPVSVIEEGIIAAPTQELLRLAPSGRMSHLRPSDAVMGPLVYTARFRPAGWPA